MARKMHPKRSSRLGGDPDDFEVVVDRHFSDDEADIRFSLTALGEAVVGERVRRRPAFRGFGPCGRVVA